MEVTRNIVEMRKLGADEETLTDFLEMQTVAKAEIATVQQKMSALTLELEKAKKDLSTHNERLEDEEDTDLFVSPTQERVTKRPRMQQRSSAAAIHQGSKENNDDSGTEDSDGDLSTMVSQELNYESDSSTDSTEKSESGGGRLVDGTTDDSDGSE